MLPVILALAVVALVLVERGAAVGSTAIPLCAQPTAGLAAGKAANLQQVCARIAQDQQVPVVPGGYDPRPPSDIPTIPAGVPNGPVYGIVPMSPTPPWLRNGDFYEMNSWAGPSNIVYAGSLSSDRSQGVVYLADRFNGSPFPSELGEFLTPAKDGGLTITSASGTVLTLTASDGATYQFDVAHQSLTRGS